MGNWMIFWLIAIVVLSLIELATIQLVAVWPAIGGVFGLLACTLGWSVPAQFVVFIAVSAVLLVLTRPMVRRFIHTRHENTNADRLIGRTAIVTEDIRNLEARGAAVYSGITWTARTADGSPADTGDKVRIERIEGSKLIVAKLPADAVTLPADAVKLPADAVKLPADAVKLPAEERSQTPQHKI